MDLSLTRLIKAGKPGPDNRGIYCNDDEVFIGPDCALIRADTDCAGRKSYTLRPRSEIAHLLDAAHVTHFGLDSLMSRLNVIAKALNDGDMALARIAALQLGLPELADGAAVTRMAAADRLLKYNFNPDELRDSNGQWTTDGSADADPQPQLVTQNAQSPVAAQARPSSHVHFCGWDRLSPEARSALVSLGEEYHRRTGADLAVTSGTRTPESQAAAMHSRLQRGQQLRYRNIRALHEILRAYNDARNSGADAQGTIDAVDVSSRTMSARQRSAFKHAACDQDARVVDQGDHFHLELRE